MEAETALQLRAYLCTVYCNTDIPGFQRHVALQDMMDIISSNPTYDSCIKSTYVGFKQHSSLPLKY